MKSNQSYYIYGYFQCNYNESIDSDIEEKQPNESLPNRKPTDIESPRKMVVFSIIIFYLPTAID